MSMYPYLPKQRIVTERGIVPLNIDPTAPSLENMLVPVPVVFSPAAGYSMSGNDHGDG